jgi:hypothetical protein
VFLRVARRADWSWLFWGKATVIPASAFNWLSGTGLLKTIIPTGGAATHSLV